MTRHWAPINQQRHRLRRFVAGSAVIGIGLLGALQTAAAPTAGASGQAPAKRAHGAAPRKPYNGVALVNGDVLAATGSGLVKHFSPSGTLLDTLDTTTGSTYTTGMCFLSSHNLLVTDFSTNTISEFDSGGNLVTATWATLPSVPESCTVDASDNVYVGGPLTPVIYKFNSSGTLLNSFSVASGGRTGGADWVDLSSDQCTILYTGEGADILSFNVCTSTQNANFATGLPGPCFELRIRPNGEVMVACASEVLRLSSTGTVTQTYPVTGSSQLFAMNLDPDNTTFWTGDIGNGEVSHVDIATGNILGQFNSSPSTQLAGLIIVGGLVVGQPSITLSPPTQTDAVGTTATVTATITNPGGSISGQTVTFTVTGMNPTGPTNETTNASGQATFTYVGANPGNDTVTGSFTNNHNVTVTGTATVTWTGVSRAPTVDDSSTLFGTSSVTDGHLTTSAANDLVVVYVSADGPAKGGQTVTVSGSGLTWTRVAHESGGSGDAEVWMANAGTKKVIKVTAKAGKKGFHLVMTDVTYKNATGIGAHGTFFSASGAPTGTITTTQNNSWVWAVGFDWLKATSRTVGPGQTLFSQTLDNASKNTFWTQSTTNPTPTAATPVTINDTAPATDPYDLVLVEIL